MGNRATDGNENGSRHPLVSLVPILVPGAILVPGGQYDLSTARPKPDIRRRSVIASSHYVCTEYLRTAVNRHQDKTDEENDRRADPEEYDRGVGVHDCSESTIANPGNASARVGCRVEAHRRAGAALATDAVTRTPYNP